MDEERIIDVVTKAYSNSITREEAYEILYSYCISKGKPSLASEMFVKAVLAFGMASDLINYIIDYYTKEYKLNILRDKNGKLIKVLKNEEINCKTICHSKESGTECQPFSGKEE